MSVQNAAARPSAWCRLTVHGGPNLTHLGSHLVSCSVSLRNIALRPWLDIALRIYSQNGMRFVRDDASVLRSPTPV